MSYTKQEFKSGEKLYAAQLNAMDEQIAANEAKGEELSVSKIDKNGVDQVTKDNADFVVKRPGANLFNEATMAVLGSWFYWDYAIGSGAGKKVLLHTSANTAKYSAIEIPITKTGDITIRMSGGVKIYAYFFVNDDNISTDAWGTAISTAIADGYTLTAPEGATKLLLSLLLYEEFFNAGNKLMINYGSSGEPWEEYGERYVLNGVFVEDPRTDAASSIVGEEHNVVKLMMPEKYSLVVGDTFELFYKGIINAVNPDIFDVRVICEKGNAYTKRYIWTPTADDIGSHALTVELYGINHNLISTKTIQLVVKNKADSPASPVNVLCVGDSLTAGGAWPSEVYRRLTASDGTPAGDGLSNINFIGTRKNGEVGFEGYGGWSFKTYLEGNVSSNRRIITCVHDKSEDVDQHSIYKDTSNGQWKIEAVYNDSLLIISVAGDSANIPTSGTLTWVSGGVNHADIVYTDAENAPGNPFWNVDTNTIDIAGYAEKLGVSSIDYLYVLLGWNDAATDRKTYVQRATLFLNYFRNYNPNIKIVFMGLQIPARDGLGTNYGARGVYTDYYGLMQYVFNLDEWYSGMLASYEGVLSTISIAGQFDTEHNSITAIRPVNARNSETEIYQSNGVHPANTGYMQIADAVYRDLTHKLQS